MREIHDQAETTMDADANARFTRMTDLEGLPDWNRTIERVIDQPGLHPAPAGRSRCTRRV